MISYRFIGNLRVNVLGGYLDSMEQDKTFLGTEPIGKLLMKLAVPTVIAQLVNMLYNIIDRVYIGHIPGEGSMALTGVGVCMPLILIIAAFAALVGSGGSPRASIYMGKGEHDTAEKILTGCLSLQIIVSIILTVILLIWNENLLLMFGASENTISYATAYMNIYAIGTIFVQITHWYEYIYHCPGKSHHRYDDGSDRSGCEYYTGSDFYLRDAYGSARRSTGNRDFTGFVLHLGVVFPLREKDAASDQKRKYYAGTSAGSAMRGTWCIHVCYAGQ